MKIYRYAKKQYIKLTHAELLILQDKLILATATKGNQYMRNPIDNTDLKVEKLNFNECIGCGWLQVLILHTNNNYGAKWGFNTYLKQAR